MDKLDLIESRISEIRPMMSELQTLLTEQKEMKKKLEQMRVGNTIIEKNVNQISNNLSHCNAKIQHISLRETV